MTPIKSVAAWVGACALALPSGTALARDHGPRHHGGRDHLAQVFQMLHAADTNGDNAVTRDEVTALQSAMFEWSDRNGDGVLSIEDRSPIEQFAAQQRRTARDERAQARDDEGLEPREPHQGRRHRGSRVDENKDGAVSRAEFLGRDMVVFERLDANGDDVIDAEELDAAAARREDRLYWWRDEE